MVLMHGLERDCRPIRESGDLGMMIDVRLWRPGRCGKWPRILSP